MEFQSSAENHAALWESARSRETASSDLLMQAGVHLVEATADWPQVQSAIATSYDDLTARLSTLRHDYKYPRNAMLRQAARGPTLSEDEFYLRLIDEAGRRGDNGPGSSAASHNRQGSVEPSTGQTSVARQYNEILSLRKLLELTSPSAGSMNSIKTNPDEYAQIWGEIHHQTQVVTEWLFSLAAAPKFAPGSVPTTQAGLSAAQLEMKSRMHKLLDVADMRRRDMAHGALSSTAPPNDEENQAQFFAEMTEWVVHGGVDDEDIKEESDSEDAGEGSRTGQTSSTFETEASAAAGDEMLDLARKGE